LHHEIKQIVGGVRGGFFLEAGALDGLYQSNTAYLESYLGWRGILVEPLPAKVIECARNRPRSEVVHCGLVRFGYGKPYIELRDLDAMTMVEGIDGVDVERRVESQRELGFAHHAMRFLAPARTLDSVLADFGYPAVDLFSLDVEGAELEVLNGIDFSRARMRNLVIETDRLRDVEPLLAAHGYLLARQLTFHDYHFVPSAK
jgi:FkbM family methyltransferase